MSEIRKLIRHRVRYGKDVFDSVVRARAVEAIVEAAPQVAEATRQSC
jgi:hypothetical protein